MLKKEGNWNKIAVVLVNYNGKEILADCIESLKRNSENDIDILVVDNGSEDNSMESIESRYWFVHTEYLGRNMGFGSGCNRGMEISFLNGAQYVLLLNTDTEIEKGMISELLKHCDDNTLAIPRIYKDKADKDGSLWYSGGNINFETADVDQTLYPYDSQDGANNMPKEVGFATGCCMMISKVIWEKTGGFDEGYFLYYEDADFCMRLRKCGIRILYVPKAALWHKVGGSAGGEASAVSQYYTVRNRLFFADKYKQYMKSDVIGILKIIMEQRTYFTTPYDKNYEKIVLGAIKDYLKGIRGRERNFFHDGYTVVNGFFDLEVEGDGNKYWQWCGENVAEIEIRNPYAERKIAEITGSVWLPENVTEKKVDVYVEGKYYCSIYAPEKSFCVQVCLEAGKKSRLCFIAEGEKDAAEELHIRKLVFCMENMSVIYKDFCNYTSLSGFYGREEKEERYWQWSGSEESELELWNPDVEERLLELTGNILLPEGVENREISIYWNGEYRCSIHAPQTNISIQGLVQAEETARVRFVTNCEDKGERDTSARYLVFCLENAEVRKRAAQGYLSVSGFYGIEEAEGKYWQWSGSEESELKLWNPDVEERLLELTGNILLPEGVENRTIDIYWDGEYRCSVHTPQTNISIQGLVQAEGTARVSFVTKFGNKKTGDPNVRLLVFCLESAEVRKRADRGYLSVSGFYGVEEEEEKYWQWSGSEESELEMWNPDREQRLLELTGNILLPEGVENRTIDVYWNGEHRCSIHAPQLDISIQGLVNAGGMAKVKFVTKCVNKKERDINARFLMFCLENTEIRKRTVQGYLSVSGFYKMEEQEGKYWQWSGSEESELEIWNPNSEPRIIELAGSIWLPEGEKGRKIDIYWNGEYHCSFNAPQADFAVRGIAGAKENVRIGFKVKGMVKKKGNGRTLLFSMYNATVNVKQYTDCVLVNGAYQTEYVGSEMWNWISETKIYMQLINRYMKEREAVLSFILLPPPTRDDVCVTIREDEEIIAADLGVGAHHIQFQFGPGEKRLLSLQTKEEAIKGFNGDPRTLCYQIKNVQLEMR